MPPVKLTYAQIADDLEARIRAGEYPDPDKPLPSYAQLADLYGVSRSTAQQAVRILRERGVVVGVLGRGLFVVPRET